MPKDYIGKFVNRILRPGDSRYNDPSTPWGGIRNLFGWEKPDAVKVPIAGFFLLDRRLENKPVAIFKNIVLFQHKRNTSTEAPIPFISLDEILHYKSRMHLSFEDDKKVEIHALAPDPGMGMPMPNRMWVDKHTAKSM